MNRKRTVELSSLINLQKRIKHELELVHMYERTKAYKEIPTKNKEQQEMSVKLQRIMYLSFLEDVNREINSIETLNAMGR